MHLLCNAYWLDTDALQGCDLPIIKEATYGFNQNADVVATLPPSPLDNFCASAKHNDSPNTFSIDSASLISSGSDCTAAGGSVQTAPLEEEVEEATPTCNNFCSAGGAGGDGKSCFVYTGTQCSQILWPPVSCVHSGVGGRGSGSGFCRGISESDLPPDQCECVYHSEERAIKEATRLIDIKKAYAKETCDGGVEQCAPFQRACWFKWAGGAGKGSWACQVQTGRLTQAQCVSKIENECARAADPMLIMKKSQTGLKCLATNTC